MSLQCSIGSNLAQATFAQYHFAGCPRIAYLRLHPLALSLWRSPRSSTKASCHVKKHIAVRIKDASGLLSGLRTLMFRGIRPWRQSAVCILQVGHRRLTRCGLDPLSPLAMDREDLIGRSCCDMQVASSAYRFEVSMPLPAPRHWSSDAVVTSSA
ncbi:hypothetical protein BDV96DRAFT_284864 [Lophiotrema nucula]|uniref:Uncharacterized protein n=1 Tax=Lophiotrema nucula TaxID=690887 RepID=A0A6A5YP64_9PLEO|nr:hypothetical protein BDV96DRAFT_284864 [Lophiotrema nucula]